MSCPICNRPAEPKFKPFCSKRCADIDLGKWLTGSYAIPSNDLEDLDELEEQLRHAETPKPH
ncbi:DNA gyrase inhibitor YacG [Loktanella agnita]|uniref:DNA gyrase inhibitor YacG n=1 Tax=Loktanella agnita TaxID=287097 RepID=UPI00398621DF